MSDRAYHHGNLRSALLEQAGSLLRESGADALSLREVARRAGVSHGAPRAHFPDKQALLDALAAEGFDRLTTAVASAIASDGSTRERFRRLALAYVGFAVREHALMDLMFTAKVSGADGAVDAAASRMFGVMDSALAPRGTASRERFKLLFAAIMQGTASLIISGRVSPEQGERMVDDAVDVILSSPLGAEAVGVDG